MYKLSANRFYTLNLFEEFLMKRTRQTFFISIVFNVFAKRYYMHKGVTPFSQNGRKYM